MQTRPRSPSRRTPAPATAAATQQLACTEIMFVHSPEFKTLTEASLASEAPEQILQQSSTSAGAESHEGRSILLTVAGERYLFRRMNFLKFKANALRSRLNPARPSKARIQEIERLLKLAQEARSQIVESNIRLAISLAGKFSNSTSDFDEYVGEANLILLKAVDKFDYSRGFRFSTYATHAIQRHFFRLTQRKQRRSKQELAAPQELLSQLAMEPDEAPEFDPRSARELVRRLPEFLDQREQAIIQQRFGLNGETNGDTLKAVADRVGLSKERVRQLQSRAIHKLHDLAVQMKIQPDVAF